MTLKALARQPLIRLLAINCAAGVAAALLMLGGLLTLNPGNLRALILADRMGAVALGLLLFGLVVTFGSVAMGSAIMALEQGARRRRAWPPGASASGPVAQDRPHAYITAFRLSLTLPFRPTGPFPRTRKNPDMRPMRMVRMGHLRVESAFGRKTGSGFCRPRI